MEDLKIEPFSISINFETWLIINDLRHLYETNKAYREATDLLVRAAKQKHKIFLKDNNSTSWFLTWNWEKDWFNLNLVDNQ